MREKSRAKGIKSREIVTYQVRTEAKEGYFNQMPERPKKRQRISFSADRKSPPLKEQKEDEAISRSKKSSTEKKAFFSSKRASKEEGPKSTET